MSVDISDKIMGLLLVEGETLDDIKQEFRDAKETPEKQEALGMKYLGRLMPKMGELMATMGEFKTRGVELLGAERYEKFESYDVTDLDPFGLGTVFGD